MTTYTRLSEVSIKLNTMSDEYNQALRAVEERINRLNLGVEATVPLPKGFRLEYTRKNNKWGLYIADSTTFWALLDSPRFVRIEVAETLPALLEQLRINAETLVLEMKRVTISLDEAVRLINADNSK